MTGNAARCKQLRGALKTCEKELGALIPVQIGLENELRELRADPDADVEVIKKKEAEFTAATAAVNAKSGECDGLREDLVSFGC